MIRYIKKGKPGEWFEYWEENGIVMTRNNYSTLSECSSIFASLADVKYYYTHITDYELQSESTGVYAMSFDPNDILPTGNTGPRKCFCPMSTIWREGCKCGGS